MREKMAEHFFFGSFLHIRLSDLARNRIAPTLC